MSSSLSDKYWDREPTGAHPREGQGSLAEALERLTPHARAEAGYRHNLGPMVGRRITRHPREERDVLVWDFLHGTVTWEGGEFRVEVK